MDIKKENPYNVTFKIKHKSVWHKKYKGKLPNDLYPYWYWEIENKETKEKINLFMGWEQLYELIRRGLVHEKKLDIMMGRKSEFQKWYSYARQISDLTMNNRIIKEFEKEYGETK